MRRILLFTLLSFLLVAGFEVNAQVIACETAGSGDWNDASTWRSANNPSQPCPCENGYPGTIASTGGETDCPERVIIREGHTVSLGSSVRIRYNGLVVIYGTISFSSGNAGGPNSAELIMDDNSSVVIAGTGTVQATGNNTNQTNNNYITIGDTRVNGTTINNINNEPKPNQLTEGNLGSGGCSSDPNDDCDMEEISDIINNPLPIVLTSFTAALSDENVRLSWTTAKEEDFSHFEIERSIDGGKHFEQIGVIEGYGNSVITQSYNYKDMKAPFGQLYYRLRAVDIDGSFEYSPVIRLEKSLSGLLVATPNPTKGRNVMIKVPEGFGNEIQQVELYSMRGDRLMVKGHHIVNQTVSLPANVSSGMYLIRITHNGLIENVRIILN